MKNRTTIQIPKALKDDLQSLKRYKRETYEEVIRKLMKKKDAKKKIKQVIKNSTRALK